MSLAVIIPTRGRAAAVADQWETMAHSECDAIFPYLVDNDDPELGRYLDLLETTNVGLFINEAVGGMIGALNRAANVWAPTKDYIGFMGDDHRPRTPGWGRIICDELDRLGTGIVYGNDLLQGANLPTAVFMTSNIVRALGHMALPELRHMYADNYWRSLGEALGALTYLPDVIIEHLHPVAEKAEWDDTYKATNTAETYDHDRVVFEKWLANDLPGDVEKIRAFSG